MSGEVLADILTKVYDFDKFVIEIAGSAIEIINHKEEETSATEK